jgi:hypothetical protein
MVMPLRLSTATSPVQCSIRDSDEYQTLQLRFLRQPFRHLEEFFVLGIL